MEFTIENYEFLNNFYNKVKEFCGTSFVEVTHELNKNGYFNFDKNELLGLILLNKAFFQKTRAYFNLIDSDLPLAAFDCLRSLIEAARLIRLYTQSKDFRQNYINNSNFDFRTVRDNEFIQGKIIKELEKIEIEFRKRKRIHMSSILFNHKYTKNSAFSELHSELSKWSHALNFNLYAISSVYDNRVSLKVESEITPYLQAFIQKYNEALYLIISDYVFLYPINSKKFLDLQTIMNRLYGEYIELIYNEK